MQKLNRSNVLDIVLVGVIAITILFWYRFLWPVLLFIALGYLPSKLFKK